MRSSALPRRTALLALFSLIFSALMLTTSLYLHRKALDTIHISFQHGKLVQAPQSDHAEYEGEHRLVTSVVYDVDFEVALRNLIDLTPDEVRAGQLLSPIDYSDGTSMLRDLAVRTRIFGALFTKWESLHIVHSARTGDVSIRENIVEHIRQNFSDDASEAIQRYDQVRSFMNRFSRHLFPWTAGHSADHMLLHASFATGGRGIVITVSDHQIVYVLTSINTFRDLGCKLPVEVFYLGDSDMHEGSRAALAKLPGVTTRDLSKMVYDEGWTLEGEIRMPTASSRLVD
jgi:alpha 1,3-mannosyltransferase